MICDKLNIIANSIASEAYAKEIENSIAKMPDVPWTKDNADGSIYRKIGARAPLDGQRPYGPEGVILDIDGEEVSVLLYVDSNFYVCEIEFIKNSGEKIKSLRFDTFKICL